MSSQLTLSNKEVAIVANGDFLDATILREATLGKIIVALDGAANRLQEINIKPDIILGDFDSINPQPFGIVDTFATLENDEKPYTSQQGYFIVPAKDQKYTDLSKALIFCDRFGVHSITLLCALGGRMDHHEGAIRSLRGHYRKERHMVMHTPIQSLSFIKNDQLTIHGKPGDKIGILAFPAGTVTTQGLEYEAENYALIFGFSENICNSMLSNQATISVHGEALIVRPPMYESQRLPSQQSA